ncbi:MAG: class I SAM-dependent methyltransferase [Phycisphaerae bacterium]|nr:class I SAM-dependent methyltransferase [Phycisphaerae bacterium]
MTHRSCRFCQNELTETFVDLGMSPLSNAYLKKEELAQKETMFPLHAWVCSHCFLVQLESFETPEGIFGEYAYFSSYSSSWLEHCRVYADNIIPQLKLGETSQVVELASNDGYLLQYFKQHGIPVLGIEPARNVARVARDKGIPTEAVFFGQQTAQELRDRQIQADLLIGNNVLAHVPDINDFVAGMQILLAQKGTITMEFPHLLRLIEKNQFDTIYHEHFSYLSLHTVETIFAHHGLRIYNVEEYPTHGGSIRIYACHQNAPITTLSSVEDMKLREKDFGLLQLQTYKKFPVQVKEIREQLTQFLREKKSEGKTVLGYGAPAKGNTLLTYCEITTDLLAFTVDRSEYKQGHYLPGSHLPILSPEDLLAAKPDYVLILPWNLKDEIMEQMAEIRQWGGQFVVPIPKLEILP